MMMVGGESASYDRASRRQMNRQLVCDGRMFDIGHALRREQHSEDMAVLAGFARRERGNRSDRQPQVKTDTVEVARTDSGTGEDKHPMLGEKPSQFLDDRKYCFLPSIHNGAATNLYDLQPRKDPDRTPAFYGTGEVFVEKGLTR